MYSAEEAAEITGLSAATLRYYEREGLQPQIAGSSSKYRQYTDEDIERIKMIQCMRMANMPIQSIKQYVSLLMPQEETVVIAFYIIRRGEIHGLVQFRAGRSI